MQSRSSHEVRRGRVGDKQWKSNKKTMWLWGRIQQQQMKWRLGDAEGAVEEGCLRGRRYHGYWWSVLFGWWIERGSVVPWLCVCGRNRRSSSLRVRMQSWLVETSLLERTESVEVVSSLSDIILPYFHTENKHLIQHISNSANISEQILGHLMLWNVTLGHLSFLCVWSTGNELITTLIIEDISSQEEFSYNFIFLSSRESHISLIRDIKAIPPRIRVRELQLSFNSQRALIF